MWLSIKKFFVAIYNFFKEKNKKKKIIKLFSNIKSFFKNNFSIVLAVIIFVIMDIFTRLYASEITFYKFFTVAPRLFSLGYIILFVGLIYNLKTKYGKYLYYFVFIVFFTLFVVNNIYYGAMNNFFNFSLISLAGEGSDYFFDVLVNTNVFVYLAIILVLVLFIISVRNMKKNNRFNKKNIIWIIIVFLICHLGAKLSLGKGNFELTWDTWRNPRNVYDNFNDSNKGMALAGLYEYSVRDFYITYLKPSSTKSEAENEFLDDVFSSNNDSYHKNGYTGFLKDKNVIFLQLEGIDDWVFNKDVMPNLYSLLNNSINFKNHYSFYSGGGSTFNSEFAVNTGYFTPFTYPANAYSMNKNDFPYSMANLMKQNNYNVSAYHMNSKEYYSRGINYSNWGYDQYYGLLDTGDYTDTTYYLDRELILNDKFYDSMFNSDGKFVNYIITYSNHLPFEASRGVSSKILDKKYEDEFKNMSSKEIIEFKEKLNLSEEDCIKLQAGETDYMVGLLMKALKDNNLYDNTVIVAYADHYLYTASDDVISKHKDTSNNLVNHTPFFIWSSNIKKKEVTKVTTQLNILPTFLNLMGIKYNEKWYIMGDALDKNYKPLAIFSDLSWYDGTYYVLDGVVSNKKKISSSSLEEKNSLVEYLVKKNDLVLKYDYFKEIIN